MSQPLLFDPGPELLMDDADGRVLHVPALVAAETATAWFEALLHGLDWRAQRRDMYGREVDVPRLLAGFALADPALPATVAAARDAVAAHASAPFTHVGINLYRDGRDSVAPHNDTLDELVPRQPIALLSLGETRRMVIRRRRPPGGSLHMDLAAGSLLLMSWRTQLHCDHGIPKDPAVRAPRISLAFRVRPPAAA
ncbi:alpha-ketoglutarate-dependent dioxygenase AlkB [Coralloluteibacterium stylophorae]|uniref:Alpha-ketoglutarate-dependent dioxygenase AlkB n=1 Tax=Coralloluteibacterium stylophorae TaxID=1776034 RepID=A0A8J8AXA4_9GAMM|nr:alpha-ketoglutarate-dependent dioxygenase AlkB [Coralloluteibacterium stylophorae]MBS7455624.1 alpha-ketoglutarate-dependent dioxygenase AlkB [Coralloluteibacterium stylophorae]